MNLFDKSQVAENLGAQLLHPGSRILFRHWETLRAERACPNRDEIQLRTLSKLMPNLAIIEPGSEPNTPIFKLAGTAVCELFQRLLTGQQVAEGFDRFERRVIGETLSLSFDRLQPCLIRLRFIGSEDEVNTAELLALPVHNARTCQTQLFCGLFPFAETKRSFSQTLSRIELVSTRMIWTEHLNGDRLMEEVGRKAAPAFRVIHGGLN